jgi:shikimate dehydrogenase
MAEPHRRAFVLGHPISHSRSPKIHGHWLAEHRIDGRYDAIDVAPGTLREFLRAVRNGSFVGGNITVPLKEEALAAVDCLTEAAKAIGAVNTVWMQSGELWGDNTDAYGFAANLTERAPGWDTSKTALVTGAGGASRAIIRALLDAGIESINLLNRTLERAEALAELFGPKVSAAALSTINTVIADADLIINTSSMGMAGKGSAADGIAIDFSRAKPSAIATDIVYVPLETAFLAGASYSSLKTVDGLGMLLHQAVPGFERWFGIRPSVTPQLRAMIEADIPAAQSIK